MADSWADARSQQLVPAHGSSFPMIDASRRLGRAKMIIEVRSSDVVRWLNGLLATMWSSHEGLNGRSVLQRKHGDNECCSRGD
jgi:hypothetical protein